MTEAALSTDPDAALGKLTVEDVSGLNHQHESSLIDLSSDSCSSCRWDAMLYELCI